MQALLGLVCANGCVLILGLLLTVTDESGAERLKASMAEGLVALITLMTLINVAMLAFMLAMRRGHNGQFSKKRGHEDDPGTLQVARQEIAKLKEQHTNELKNILPCSMKVYRFRHFRIVGRKSAGKTKPNGPQGGLWVC